MPPPSLRILIVDDNEEMGFSLRLLLQSAGYQVEVIQDGASALATAAEYAPDVAIIDLHLPDMTGYQLARALRRSASLPAMRLIALSGESNESLAMHEADFDHFLKKPASPEELLNAIGG